jgi:hypothetical protein
MGTRWKPPRRAKPRKIEKDPQLEEAILEILISRNRGKTEKEREEWPEQVPESGNEQM